MTKRDGSYGDPRSLEAWGHHALEDIVIGPVSVYTSLSMVTGAMALSVFTTQCFKNPSFPSRGNAKFQARHPVAYRHNHSQISGIFIHKFCVCFIPRTRLPTTGPGLGNSDHRHTFLFSFGLQTDFKNERS